MTQTLPVEGAPGDSSLLVAAVPAIYMQYSVVILLTLITLEARRSLRLRALSLIAIGWLLNFLHLAAVELNYFTITLASLSREDVSARPFLAEPLSLIGCAFFSWGACRLLRESGRPVLDLGAPQFLSKLVLSYLKLPPPGFFFLAAVTYGFATSVQAFGPHSPHQRNPLASLPILLFTALSVLSLLVLPAYFRLLAPPTLPLSIGIRFYALVQILYPVAYHETPLGYGTVLTLGYFAGLIAKTLMLFGLHRFFVKYTEVHAGEHHRLNVDVRPR